MGPRLEEAKALIAAAQKAAEEIDKPMTVAVVDSGGFVIALERMDGARPLTPAIATSKAYTAAVMERPSNMLKDWCKSSPEFFAQLSNMSLHPIVATDGGVTLKRKGVLMGGIGISGGSPQEDQAIAEKALVENGFELDFDAFNKIRK